MTQPSKVRRSARKASGRKAPKAKRVYSSKATRAGQDSASTLRKQLKSQFAELAKARAQQAATADVLKVIARSPTDVQPVFDAIVKSAAKFFEPCAATITSLKDDKLHWNAIASLQPDFGGDSAKAIYPIPLDPERSPSARAMLERRIIEIPDTASPDTPDFTRRAAAAEGVRSATFIPLISQGKGIGTIILSHPTAGFRLSEKQLSLVQTFADQAVIAIENARLFNETQEALERQTATADILKVIASSPSDVQPVFEAIVGSAARLFEPCSATVTTLKDGKLDWNATTASVQGFDVAQVRTLYPIPFDPDRSPSARAIFEHRIIEIPDTDAPDTPEYARKAAAAGGFRAIACVPLIDQDQGIGAIIFAHPQKGFKFSDKQLALVQTFADQAVIAIQNARLFDETREALARQTATSNVLKVIASSPSDLQPVFEAIAERANELIGGHSTSVFRLAGDTVELAAATSVSKEADAVLRAAFPRLASGLGLEGIFQGKMVETIDATADTEPETTRTVARARGFRSRLLVPLNSDSGTIGFISITRKQPGAFVDKDVELLRTFADQAVIAIQNVELFEEVQAKTGDLEESLLQQTATADVLKVISRSAFDLRTVLDTLTQSAVRLCAADSGVIFQRDGNLCRLAAIYGFSTEVERFAVENPLQLDRGSVTGRVILDGKAIHIQDVLTDPEYRATVHQRSAEFRTMLGVPLLREGVTIGSFALTRTEVNPFSEKQIELVTTFADQAVIAMENARLFNETKVALERQTATADVLKVIASSPSNLDPVFEAIAKRSNRLLAGHSTAVWRFVDDLSHLVAFTSTDPTGDQALRSLSPLRIGQNPAFDILRRGEVVHIPDTEDIQLSMPKDGADMVRDVARARGYRSQLMAPLVGEQKAVGWISITRIEPGGFAPEDVQMLRTFADQAVIAISNVELFQAVEARTRELSRSLEELRKAQDRLIQTEKLASLGQLTAGIAHEIKNPLNFVNNFSALSTELTNELNDVLTQETLTDRGRQEVTELIALLRDNLTKVVQHGRRADSIVKNMLLHSREGSGERRSADINALVGESLNLAYHGARAEKPNFAITLKHDLDPGAGALDLYPQEITRALLNLISNGFYAATRRRLEAGDESFEPILSAATRNLGKTVEIRIRDNGTGIPPEVKEKMFNPFFTTKPTGEGTGLGLSMTYDIIVKQHGGRIDVETEPGVFTEFIITLPRDDGIIGSQKPE